MTDAEKREAIQRLYLVIFGKGADDLPNVCDDLSKEIESIGKHLDGEARQVTGGYDRQKKGGRNR